MLMTELATRYIEFTILTYSTQLFCHQMSHGVNYECWRDMLWTRLSVPDDGRKFRRLQNAAAALLLTTVVRSKQVLRPRTATRIVSRTLGRPI